MKLEINKQHKKIDIKDILNNINPRRVKAGVTALFISLSLINFTKTHSYAEELNHPVEYSEQVDDIQIVITGNYNRANILLSQMYSSNDKITISSLSNIKDLSINTDEDISFLEYCTNLESLSIICNSYDGIKRLSEIPNFNKLKHVSLSCKGAPISKEYASFLLNSSTIETIELDNQTMIEDGVLSSMLNLKNIEITADSFGVSFDTRFEDLVNIESLEKIIIDSRYVKPLNLAVSFDTNTYNALIEKGIVIDFGDNINIENKYGKTQEEIFIDVNKTLDEIVLDLDLDDSLSEIEKYNEILLYVIDKLEYDLQVENYVKIGVIEWIDFNKFYELGTLQGAIYRDSAICGNYTALLNALCKRVGIEVYFIHGRIDVDREEHAWSLIRLDGEYYYADATAFDSEAIKIIEVYEDENGMTEEKITYDNIDVESKRKAIEDGSIYEYNNYLIDMKNETRVEFREPIEFEFGEAKYLNDEEEMEDNTLIDNISSNNINDQSKDSINMGTAEINEEVIDLTNKKFKVSIGGKIAIISAPLLVAALSTMGLIKKKKSKKIEHSIIEEEINEEKTEEVLFENEENTLRR